MFKANIFGHNKIWGTMRPGGYGPGLRYKKSWKPLVDRTKFPGVAQSKTTSEQRVARVRQKWNKYMYSVALSLIAAIVCW